jgi:hypothetical protein
VGIAKRLLAVHPVAVTVVFWASEELCPEEACMHCETRRFMLGCALFLVVSLAGLPSYGSTCDHAVQFKDGLLSIAASGCSLEQVLTAVQLQAGIEVEIPPSAARVPIVANIEPGQPSAVLTTLLSTTKFNYYLVPGAENTVARVVITEPSAPTAPPVLATPVPQVAATAQEAAPTTAKKKVEKKKKDKVEVANNEVINTDQDPTPKPEIDESTLRNLPQLPPGLPVAMWKMYPDIVQNGGVVANVPLTMSNGTPVPAQANPQEGNPYNYQEPPPLPKGVVGLPALPPDINPAIGKLYPYNLMQTINGPITYPSIVLPPMALPIGVTPTHP